MSLSMQIDLTVALPVYNSSKILWLCLEGLCRQQTTRTWELIVMEDPSDNYAGEDYLNAYADRLKEAGCVNVCHVNLDKWITLGDKWINIAKRARGENFMLTAADNFSPPNRIEISCESLKTNLWFDGRSSLFYNVLTNDSAKFTAHENVTGVWMCTKTKLVRQLNGPGPSSGIDGWMRNNMRIKKTDRYTTRDLLPDGLHTDGLNNISFHRRKRYGGVGFTINRIEGIKPGSYGDKPYYIAVFEKTDINIKDILPGDVYEKLVDLHIQLNKKISTSVEDVDEAKPPSKTHITKVVETHLPPPEPGPVYIEKRSSPDLKSIFPQQL